MQGEQQADWVMEPNAVLGEAGGLRKGNNERRLGQGQDEYFSGCGPKRSSYHVAPGAEQQMQRPRSFPVPQPPPSRSSSLGQHTKHPPSSSDCRFGRNSNASLLATSLGILSLACLLGATITGSWVHTEESVASPLPPPSAVIHGEGHIYNTRLNEYQMLRIHFKVGLWRVCPSLEDSSYKQLNIKSGKLILLILPYK